jgi:hypothetical protein
MGAVGELGGIEDERVVAPRRTWLERPERSVAARRVGIARSREAALAIDDDAHLLDSAATIEGGERDRLLTVERRRGAQQ